MVEILALILGCLVIAVIWLGSQIGKLTDRLGTMPGRVSYGDLDVDSCLAQRGETCLDAAQRILNEAARAHRLLMWQSQRKEDHNV